MGHSAELAIVNPLNSKVIGIVESKITTECA